MNGNVGGWCGSKTDHHPNEFCQLSGVPPTGELPTIWKPDRAVQASQRGTSKGKDTLNSRSWGLTGSIWSFGGLGSVVDDCSG